MSGWLRYFAARSADTKSTKNKKWGSTLKKILITGSTGQIGADLAERLREQYGEDNVITSARGVSADIPNEPLFERLDVTDAQAFYDIAKKHQVDTILHLAAVLSAVGEKDPQLLWHINMNGLQNALEISRELGTALFVPSSIGAFGPSTPKVGTPQVTIQRPTTMYGVSKVAGELMCDYYYLKYGVDTRGVRFPGLISYKALPGGGTTDYAVHIYYDALKKNHYTSFIAAGTKMDMMYMPDAVECIIDLMEADPSRLIDRNAFNVSSMSFDPEELKESIRKVLPDFTLDYDVDPVRQAIAESWPDSLDCTEAREQWGFNPQYDLDAMTVDMLEKIGQK